MPNRREEVAFGVVQADHPHGPVQGQVNAVQTLASGQTVDDGLFELVVKTPLNRPAGHGPGFEDGDHLDAAFTNRFHGFEKSSQLFAFRFADRDDFFTVVQAAGRKILPGGKHR